MTTYLGKSCSFFLPRVPFVNCRQFMYLVISLLVLRAGYGIWLYQFLIIAYLFTLYCYIKVLKVKPVYQQMTLSPKLGVVGISTLWHFRLPLPIQMFIKVASSPRLSGIGMPSPILWSHPLKMQRIVLLSSLLWWEPGTNSLITGPGEWLSFRHFTSNLSWSWFE